MTQQISGNTKGLSPSERKSIERLYNRRILPDEFISLDVAREMCEVGVALRRRLGILIDRRGQILDVVVGTKEIIYLPDLGRFRLSRARLRNVRLIFSDLSTSNEEPVIPYDIYGDLEKLRLDMVAAIKAEPNRIAMTYAHLTPHHGADKASVITETVKDLGFLKIGFRDFIEKIEEQLRVEVAELETGDEPGAILVGVYEPRSEREPAERMLELKELARTAGLRVLDTVVQKRRIDPKTFIGKGKLEELVLRCVRLGAEMIVFDAELKPGQWRSIINHTELKVLDRSMLILDIFARRATSSEGRLQVELAQLQYNLPRLTERDSGLSRLSGGIGGRGPGETKLEVGRRRVRERLSDLENNLKKLRAARGLRRTEKKKRGMRLVSIIGYTNVGKSTLFNRITGSTVLVENKLFATLDPSQRKLFLPSSDPSAREDEKYAIISDTVGFIRDLPKELEVAFRATLEELFEASLLVHVIDASDSDAPGKYNAVCEILKVMGLENIPELVVANKSDAATPEQVEKLTNEFNAVAVSAVTGLALKELLLMIERNIALNADDRTSSAVKITTTAVF